MERSGSFPSSQKPAIGPYAKPAEYSPHSHISFKYNSNIILMCMLAVPNRFSSKEFSDENVGQNAK